MSRTPPPMPWLERFGRFGPTYRGDELKGYIASGDPDVDGKCYLSAAELREIAAECAAVADWMSPAAPPMEQGPVPQAPQGEGSKDSKPAPVSTPASAASALTPNDVTVTVGKITWTKRHRFWRSPDRTGAHPMWGDIDLLCNRIAADASELAALREAHANSFGALERTRLALSLDDLVDYETVPKAAAVLVDELAALRGRVATFTNLAECLAKPLEASKELTALRERLASYDAIEAWLSLSVSRLVRREIGGGFVAVDYPGIAARGVTVINALDTLAEVGAALAPTPPASPTGPERPWIMQVERHEDMSPDGLLRLVREDDGDMIVAIRPAAEPDEPTRFVSVQFCAVGGGGGRSPNTRRALRTLFEAMQDDNAANPTGPAATTEEGT